MEERKIQDTTYAYSIKRIKDVSFYVNERLYIDDPLKMIKVELSQTIGVNVENNSVNFTLRVFLHYQDSPENILAELYVENIFEVENLKEFVSEKGLGFPNQLLVSIISMSISHSRALLAKNLHGTVYQTVLIPITNPLEVAQHFFPSMFEEIGKPSSVAKEKKNQKFTNP